MSDSYQFKLDTVVGPLFLVASNQGLSGIFWEEQPHNFVQNLENTEQSQTVAFLKLAVIQLNEYFKGERTSFDLNTDVKGTDFQKKVWRELSQIPYGTTLSYKDIALKLKCKAYRAIGSANGKNPLSIIVPCHRVIANGGGLGGYAGGLEIKKRLLNLETQS